ncbi:hypothetical protein KAR91_21945 [Candidatus Pacearchaeota archaeon]|nr:hypothetical protein [Candidatus Pacearchaeota archaeon]
MGLILGKSLDRSYNIRIPFLNGYYNIGVYFNKRSTFLLFKIDPDFPRRHEIDRSSKISMFKNLESSRFAETFLTLHNYRSTNLDISNQFQELRSEYHFDVNLFMNETINLSKVGVNGKDLFDTLTIYGLSLTAFSNEFVFMIAERQNIVKKLNKKIVRTTAVQISTTPSLTHLDDFYNERLESERLKEKTTILPSDEKEVIRLSDEDEKLEI